MAGGAAADPTDERFLDGLRTRRLFSLAETYCRDRLAQAEQEAAKLFDEWTRSIERHVGRCEEVLGDHKGRRREVRRSSRSSSRKSNNNSR